MTLLIKAYLKDQSGATAIEYGLIAALISIGIIVSAKSLGTSINSSFENAATELAKAGES